MAGVAIDVASGMMHLTLHNDPKFNNFSLIPYIEFNGVNRYLSRSDEANLDIIGDEAYITNPGLMLGGWFWFDDAAGALEALMAKWEETRNDRAYRLIRAADGTIQMWVSVDGTATVSQASSLTPGANEWVFCAGRYVPSFSLDVYVGVAGLVVPERSRNFAGIPATLNNSAEDFLIGAQMNTPANFLDGRASQCILVASTPTDLVINSIYQQSKPLFGFV